ncbi:MAG: tRNA (N6-isopentenyl adenosine(37)-C2)-methylthiotransferase MiaB [Acidobacteria bacterium]|jgi:tRNA-2-methylthio-N6-dimethylallyladenosine synthase|nr:tRNA (N6-isopentenyl adenosine(37)-C2)-methylthiotransferase MiaB [Acidobacteriota bacterium]
MRSFFIETWGCQMNQHDSELIEGQLRANGMGPASSATEADLVILNTCSVRERPVRKISSRIGVLGNAPDPPIIGVCGCVAEQEGARLLQQSARVGFVLGPGQIGRLGEAIRGVRQGTRPVLVGFDAENDHNFRTIFRKSSTRGMITVIEGCNEFCTFCVVPHTRGREASRPLNAVLDEVHVVAATGVREVELLGQTINAYRCPESGADFAELLAKVAGVPELARVRYITSHPRHFDRRLINVLATHRKVSRYLHIPFQAGANEILARMHRRYTREEYLDLIARLRNAVPDINLSTDVIVGFPGESEEDFGKTLELLEEVRFGQVFAFPFSPRPKTPAARYEGQVEEAIKKDRLHRLFELTDRISKELNRELIGRAIPVLIDGDSRRNPDHWQGRGEDNRVVNFAKTGREGVGEIVDVQITRASAHSLFGEREQTGGRLPVIGAA